MELIPTNCFVSPLKGFLILSPATEEKKGGIVHSKLDDGPRKYAIGTMQEVNQKIVDFKVGLYKFDISDLVIEDASSKKPSGLKKSRQICPSRGKEKEWKVIQSGHVSATADVRQSKVPQKKVVSEKDKLVELYQYPGYNKEELTPLPNGVELAEIVEKVIHAQGKTPIGKTTWCQKMLHKFLNAPCTQAVLLDSFWWLFLQLYHPNQEIQGYLFDRIAENYSRILLGCHKVSNQENILKVFPSLLSQTVYTCFCSCFTRSWFNTHEFKAQLCDVFCEWLGGTLHAPGHYNKWDYSQLEPERSRREEMLSGKSKLGADDEDPFGASKTSGSKKKSPSYVRKRPQSSRQNVGKSTHSLQKFSSRSINQLPSSRENTYFHFHSVLHDDLVRQTDSLNKQRSTSKKRLKIAYLPRESHPACRGPEFTWHLLNISGHSPLIQHFLQSRNSEPKTGCDIFLSRREISKPLPASAETYADLIKQSFSSLRQSHRAYRKAFLRHQREMKNFDQQCKENLELFRQEEQEEIKKQKAEKKKELLSLRPDGLDTKPRVSNLPKIYIQEPDST
ncbi:protein FAM227A [Sphaerodactylus townsendi]|uniref:protein FAM227A n=1 Tax=Sphaerodactylus townsendi TaxID=933632 RepID=UPI0020264B08|nr:protein FAM227A [Sphaerodactylus townsendi]XP_048357344.1 protein FAM227A [Sphaerodactylus townsendi]XP_048357345.1 protein FAM227A [Sphaerodactylus townsendi]XP_048357347.1 protein FAM227A [Sphaerodactylus townsendi]